MAENLDKNKPIDQEKFTFVENKFQESENVTGKSYGYWADSARRLFKNKFATACLAIILLMYLFSFFVTMTTPFDTIIEPQIKDPETGRMIGKERLVKLPPRIKGLEWTPWFDGRITKSIPKLSLTDPMTKNRYTEGTYVLFDCEVDIHGQEQCKIDQDMYAQNEIEYLYFPFGTDEGARDLWTRAWTGIRNSITIAIIAASFDLILGTLYGSIAGFFGGTKIDNVMMRFTEIYGSIPNIVLLILMLSFMERGYLSLIIALVATGWIGVARMVRAQFLRYRDHDFVLASRTIGANNRRLIFKHIFPNIVGQLVILATFSIPGAIFYEATLSFIGLGLPTAASSLGSLISTGINYRLTAPYLLWVPTILLAIVMLAINLLANGLRDALDPRLRSE